MEFEIELFADGVREASDFAETSVHRYMIYDLRFMILVLKECKEGGGTSVG